MDRDELKQRRADLGLTQAELAQRLMVSVDTVSQWERGRRHVPAFLSLALDGLACRAQPKERQP